jgi:hypothetical protein
LPLYSPIHQSPDFSSMFIIASLLKLIVSGVVDWKSYKAITWSTTPVGNDALVLLMVDVVSFLDGAVVLLLAMVVFDGVVAEMMVSFIVEFILFDWLTIEEEVFNVELIVVEGLVMVEAAGVLKLLDDDEELRWLLDCGAGVDAITDCPFFQNKNTFRIKQ